MRKRNKKSNKKKEIVSSYIQPLHRGRIQAQGEHLEDSEAWAQELALKYKEGINMSHKLENRLEHRQREVRQKAFESCRAFMYQASLNGGYSGLTKTFLAHPPHERVDIDVFAGLAFIK